MMLMAGGKTSWAKETASGKSSFGSLAPGLQEAFQAMIGLKLRCRGMLARRGVPKVSRGRRSCPQKPMNDLSDQDVTEMLRGWNLGDEDALSRLIPVVYRELRQLAQTYMARERPGHTLQTTGLVHEAYLRLARLHGIEWSDRSHFYAVCASLMRRILVDWGRSRRAEKRSGGRLRVELDDALVGCDAKGLDLAALALDQALRGLAKIDPRKSKVVELRYFAGLGVKETARVLGVSPATVVRDWEFSKVWLLRELKSRPEPEGDP